jgi:O-acetylhomoserine/O-acetylserine sulfhydrylase-like pyridoxal-dependent enzyme
VTELDPATYRPETGALHAGQKPDPATSARAVPDGSPVGAAG